MKKKKKMPRRTLNYFQKLLQGYAEKELEENIPF